LSDNRQPPHPNRQIQPKFNHIYPSDVRLDGLDRFNRLDGFVGPGEMSFAVIYMNFTG
jgi:hypothetical protein